MTVKDSNSLLYVTSKLQGKQIVAPVLYYEENVVSEDYDTHTFLIQNGQYSELEKHYRTFSKTYPSIIWNRFNGAENMREEYGQLLNYYNCEDAEIYIFDRSSSKHKAKEYLLINGLSKTVITYDEDEFYFDLLYFDKYFYLLTYVQTEPTLADYNMIRIVKLTNELVVACTMEIDFSSFNLLPRNFINNSVAIVDKTILFPLRKDQDFYFLRYNSITHKADLIPIEYGLLGIIADTDCFYAVGYTDEEEIVFDTLDPSGTSMRRNSIPLPLVIQISCEEFRFDDILYMYNSEIYCCLIFQHRCFFLSYDTTTNEWKSSWVVTKGDNPFFLMDVKYMVNIGGKYFDLFPNWNNSK